MDFDGKILPSPEFSRLIYDISHAEAALRLTQRDKTQWYLLAPTEMLFVEQREDSFCLERRKGTTLLPWVRENLLPAQEGTLASRRGERSLLSELDAVRAGSKFRAQELADHLAVYFGKE